MTDNIVAILFAGLCILVLLQVISRGLHLSQPWIDEIAKFVFIWLVYLGGTVTIRRGMNITFDLLLEDTRGKLWKILFSFVNIVCLVFLVAITYIGFSNAWINRIQTSTMTGLNMGLVNLAIPIGALLMIEAQIEYWVRRYNKKEDN